MRLVRTARIAWSADRVAPNLNKLYRNFRTYTPQRSTFRRWNQVWKAARNSGIGSQLQVWNLLPPDRGNSLNIAGMYSLRWRCLPLRSLRQLEPAPGGRLER